MLIPVRCARPGRRVCTLINFGWARLGVYDYRLDVFLIDEWSGEPANIEPAEHDALGWFDVAQARRLTLADQRLLDLIAVALDGC